MHHTNDDTKWQQSEEAATAGRFLSEGRIMSVRDPEHFFPEIWRNPGQMQSKREQKRGSGISPSPYRYLYTVRALCVYTHTHVIYIGVLVVVDCGYLPLLTMMMYTHPVSSASHLLSL